MDVLALPALTPAQAATTYAKSIDKLRLVGTPNIPYSSGLRTPNGTDHLQSSNTRFPHFLRAGATEIQLVWFGYYNNNAAEQVLPNVLPFTVSLESPALNYFGQVCGFGNPALTLYPGGILVSDPIPVDLLANPLFIRHFCTAPTAGSYPTGAMFNNTTWAGSELQTTSSTDATQPGQTGFAYAANAFEFNFTQCAVIGKQLKRTLAIMGDGDSIMQGTGTNSYLSRGWLMNIVDGLYCTANIGFPSNTASNSTLSENNKSRMLYADWSDAVVEDFGTNDFAGNAADATIRAFRIERWSQYARRGLAVAAATVFMRATSTDNFATDTNQTPLTAWLAGGNAQLHNAWLRDGAPMTGTLTAGYVSAATGSHAAGVMRAGQAGHVLGAVFDQAAVLTSPNKVGCWLAGGANPYTPDGIHVTDVGVQLIAASAVAAQILSWCASIPLN
jgi:hypothetical protein